MAAAASKSLVANAVGSVTLARIFVCSSEFLVLDRASAHWVARTGNAIGPKSCIDITASATGAIGRLAKN